MELIPGEGSGGQPAAAGTGPGGSGRRAGGVVRHFFSRWTWRMAWRDSRSSRKRLLLFSCSIVLGVAALTAIGSLGDSLEEGIEEQAKSLLGADFVIGSRHPFSPEEEAWLQGLPGEQSRSISFSSMAYFPRTQGTRLVQVRAIEGSFPFYGQLETEPAEAAQAFRESSGAVVEESLLTQFDVQPGDTIRLGKLTLPVLGRLQRVPGENIVFSTIAPRVYVRMAEVSRTGLFGIGTLARYRVYFRFGPEIDVAEFERRVKPQISEFRLSSRTVEGRKRDLGRSMENMYHFLSLVAFIAVVLGGVGVASAIHLHVKQKLATVALLRCLGGSIPQTFAVYLAQATALGLAGTLAGVLLGLAIQITLPGVLADFIPFTVPLNTSWGAVVQAVAVGFGSCLLFALLPLLSVRRVSPLAALRLPVAPAEAPADVARWLVGGCLVAGIVGFAMLHSRDWRIGLGFAVGLGVVFGILTLTAKGLAAGARRWVRPTMPFSVRQGLANLHRPDNRTLLLLLSLGLGTFLIVSLHLVQQTLLVGLVGDGGSEKPNAVLFDIQPDQREPVRQLVRSLSFPVLEEVPLVTMRLSALKGRPVAEIMADRESGVPRWSLRREYRSTYSDKLRETEQLTAGTWHERVAEDAEVIPISMEEGIAKELQVGLGDEVVFDIQGVPVTTRVASLRKVEWRRIRPNFFVVFPRGVLEEAPSTHVLMTRAPSSDDSALLQREVVKAFPNVSAIDLSLILQTIDSILGRVAFVIRFMATFTVVTGLLVLMGALLAGRYQRIRESVLLRTLGASRAQVLRILFIEYLALGLLAALTGILLAVAAAWGLSALVFDVSFAPRWGSLLVALVVVPGLTVAAGLLMSRGVLNQPPLAVLRAEV